MDKKMHMDATKKKTKPESKPAAGMQAKAHGSSSTATQGKQSPMKAMDKSGMTSK